MRNTFNKGSCYICGNAADDPVDVGRCRYFSCGSQECEEEFRQMYRDYEEEKRYEAQQDNYDRYGW